MAVDLTSQPTPTMNRFRARRAIDPWEISECFPGLEVLDAFSYEHFMTFGNVQKIVLWIFSDPLHVLQHHETQIRKICLQ